jgi:glycosyltransferase involved in cell wall biosynthesis
MFAREDDDGMRILQIVTDTDRRGAQVFASDLHRAFEGRGLDVRTVALAPGAVGGLDLPVLGPGRLHRSTLRALRGELRHASVAVAHGSTTLPACAMAGFGVRTPFVYRQISDSQFWAPDRARRLRVRAGLSRATRVVALWTGAADTLAQVFAVPRSKIDIVPNGVPTDPFVPADAGRRSAARRELGLPADRPTLLSVGALSPEKGIDVAIDAVGRIPGAQLLVVGDGPERPRLETLAQEIASGRVVFTGSMPDPLPAYAAADIMVFPSRGGDSMPAVLIEAGLMALPVVSTAIGAIPEVVHDERTGLLVADSSVASLVAAITRLTADPEWAGALGRAAREHCEATFAIDVIAARWLETLRIACR